MSDTNHRTPAVMGLAARTTTGDLPTLERNSYWHGKSMGVDEFVREQVYHRTLQQILTRLTVGCGVLCGLMVSRHGDRGAAISSGAAVDGSGRLIVVGSSDAPVDLTRWICDDAGERPMPGEYRLCLLYHECPVAPAPVLVTDCDTRIECLPGAIEERYRFEARRIDRSHCDDPCPGCSQRSEGRGRCRCGDGHRGCDAECDDCVVVARFGWDGDAVAGLTMDGRIELPSLRELSRHGDVDDVVGPRLVGMWPRPGETLDRVGTPSDWGRWRYRPRVELCFDQPITWDRIDDPADWLRAWIVVSPVDGNATTVNRVDLRSLPEATTTTDEGQSVVFVLETDATIDAIDDAAAEHGFTVIVQARATSDTGPTSSGAVARMAHLDYAGTALSATQAARLWEHDELPDELPDPLTPTRLPDCFGDGYDGGTLHAAFRVAPVGEVTAVTGVFPHNGARIRSANLPSLQISGTADLGDVAPRAWLVGDGGRVEELSVGQPERLTTGAARARGRYQSAFDTTLDAELAHTLVFTLGHDGDDRPDRGRVLVVAPRIGSFAGTCLTEAEAAHVHQNGLGAEHLRHVRPSSARMPRAGNAGSWIHWTFAWEQTNVVIH